MLSRNFIAIARGVGLHRRNQASICPLETCRLFSYSRPVLKSKKRKAVLEDGFDETPEDDLFSSVSKPSKAGASRRSVPRDNAKVVEISSSLSPIAEFDIHSAFLMVRLGPNPGNKAKQIRSNALRRLLHFTTSKEQVERVADAVAAWRNSGRTVDEETTLEFTDRCLLYNPPLLLQVFSNRPKYGMDIASLPEARRILYKLVNSRPHSATSLGRDAQVAFSAAVLERASIFAALYPAYGLGSAFDDVTSCALLAQAHANTVLHLPSQATEVDKAKAKAARDKLRGTEEATEFARVLGRVVTTLKTYDAKADTAGAQMPLSKRMTGETCEASISWRWVETGLGDVVRALKKLRYKESSGRTSVLRNFIESRGKLV